MGHLHISQLLCKMILMGYFLTGGSRDQGLNIRKYFFQVAKNIVLFKFIIDTYIRYIE